MIRILLGIIMLIVIVAFLTRNHSVWDELPWGKPVVDTDLHKLTGDL